MDRKTAMTNFKRTEAMKYSMNKIEEKIVQFSSSYSAQVVVDGALISTIFAMFLTMVGLVFLAELERIV